MANQGEALQDDARAADKLSQARDGGLVLSERPKLTKGQLTSAKRSKGAQGQRKRSARAAEVAQGPKRRRRQIPGPIPAEEGAVVQQGIPPRLNEAPMPHRDKSSYDAIKEVV